MGPTVRIVTKSPVDVSVILEAVQAKSDSMEGDDFWINERPFNVSFGEEYEGELAELKDVKDWLGWIPHGMIGFSAMCNDAIDHKILGDLSIEFALLLDGVVDFGAPLNGYTKDPQFLSSNQDLCDWNGNHMMRPKIFKEWLNHPDFRMVK